GVGRACGVGRGLGVTLGVAVDVGVGVGVGVPLGVAVAVGVGVAVAVAVGVGVAVAVGVGVGVGVGVPWQLWSQFPALTITLPQSPLCVESVPTYAVMPTVVCPPLTGRNATSESPKFVAATSVAAALGVTTF